MYNLISNLTWIEAENRLKKATILIPVGSHEQHGPHMPLDTDTFFVTEVVSRVIDNLKEKMDIYTTPTIWAGYSPHHRDFPGTITLSLSTLMSLLYDICESLIIHQVRRIFIINGHGGNYAPLRAIASQIGDQLHQSPVVLNYWDGIKEEWAHIIEEKPAGIGHAGEAETSIRLYLAPDTVREDQLKEAVFYANDPQPLTGNLYEYRRFKSINPEGYLGHPRHASRQKGKQIIKKIIDSLVSIILTDCDD